MNNCEAVREGLEAYHYGDLEGEERSTTAAHLSGCAPCRAALEAVRETAAQLDGLGVPEPSELDWARFDSRLEARIAPLRARRMASSYSLFSRFGRVAAAFLIGGLSVLAGGLYKQSRDQADQIARLNREVAESAWREGDMQRYAPLVVAEAADPMVQMRLQAIQVVGDDDVAKAWALASREQVGDEVRKRVADFIATYPTNPLADQAFLALQKTGAPTLPPLERAAVTPISFIPKKPLPNETAESTARKELDKLVARGEAAGGKIAAWACFRAGRIAEEQLSDPTLAVELYGRAAAKAGAGPILEAAKARLAALGK
ncbi:MAG TPA: zf-HC2 domain-containing protein [Planctomycetota bacterium]|nr:zf-HC2 domain-containing protein [Planctomycetota bacterium]